MMNTAHKGCQVSTSHSYTSEQVRRRDKKHVCAHYVRSDSGEGKIAVGISAVRQVLEAHTDIGTYTLSAACKMRAMNATT